MSTISTALKATGVAAAAALALGLALPAFQETSDDDWLKKTEIAVVPTVVLVHGAWADASSFAPVTALLQRDGYTVLNAPNPLRDLDTDAANVAAFINQRTTGPVILVGHSYGGSVITDAATEAPTVKALVYIDAYAPDQNESTYQLTGAQPGSLLNVPDPTTVFDFVQYPQPAGSSDVDTYIKATQFQKVFAAALPGAVTNVLAAGQSPIALSALQDPLTVSPAWKTIKSYFFIGTNDKVLPPAEQLVMAKRANGVVVTAKADHLSMLEVPGQVTNLIEKAATGK